MVQRYGSDGEFDLDDWDGANDDDLIVPFDSVLLNDTGKIRASDRGASELVIDSVTSFLEHFR
jgi:hypothetical protein